MNDLDRTFQAMADPTRRAILNRLAEGSATVGELAEPFDISPPAISRHLKVLEDAGLIRREIEAQRRRCHLEAEALMRASRWLTRLERFWADRLDALDRYLDETDPRNQRRQHDDNRRQDTDQDD